MNSDKQEVTFFGHYEKMNIPGLYPDEWMKKTFLGSYPDLRRRDTNFAGKTVLDAGCGFGKNMPLLRDLGFALHGMEISENLCRAAREMLARHSVTGPGGQAPDIRVGHNTAIPFPDAFFDCVISSCVFYYIKDGESIADNKRELKRVLKPGGWFVAAFPTPNNQCDGKDYWAGAEEVFPGHRILRNDPQNLRNGCLFRYFKDRQDIIDEFSDDFEDVVVAEFDADVYGNRWSYYSVSCYLK